MINGYTDGTKDLTMSALTANGAFVANGTTTLGNATGDDVVVTGRVAADFDPKTASTYDMGDATQLWKGIYGMDAFMSIGAVGTPSHTFSTDTDTGMWSAGANTLNFATGGTDALSISSGQVATFLNAPIMTGLTASRTVETNGSKALSSVAITGTGNYVKSAAPTMTGEILGVKLELKTGTGDALTIKNTTDMESGSNGNAILWANSEDLELMSIESFAVGTNPATARMEFRQGTAGGTPVKVMSIHPSGSLTGAAEVDKGFNTTNWGGVYDSGTLLTDYVFEKYYTGAAFDEKNASYKMNTLEDEIIHTQEKFHLSTIVGRKEWEDEGSKSVGGLVTQLWETAETQFLYIKELSEKIDALQEQVRAH